MGNREQLFISLLNKCSLNIAGTWTTFEVSIETLIEADQIGLGDKNDVIADGKSHSATVAESLGLDEKTLRLKVASMDV
jgi:hypothetical protein